MMYRDFFNGKLLLDYIKILLKIWHIDFLVMKYVDYIQVVQGIKALIFLRCYLECFVDVKHKTCTAFSKA